MLDKGALFTVMAQVCYSVNRLIDIEIQDGVNPVWEDLPKEDKSMVLTMVNEVLKLTNSFELHETWKRLKTLDGWVYGEVKSNEAKTHPYLVDWHELPDTQRMKDDFFYGVIAGFTVYEVTKSPEGYVSLHMEGLK